MPDNPTVMTWTDEEIAQGRIDINDDLFSQSWRSEYPGVLARVLSRPEGDVLVTCGLMEGLLNGYVAQKKQIEAATEAAAFERERAEEMTRIARSQADRARMLEDELERNHLMTTTLRARSLGKENI